MSDRQQQGARGAKDGEPGPAANPASATPADLPELVSPCSYYSKVPAPFDCSMCGQVSYCNAAC